MNEWRNHPSLRERFHPEHPDDVQVIVHDGGPRLSKLRPELVWVTVTGCEGDVFAGMVLNKPDQLESVREGSLVKFMAFGNKCNPLMVTDKYLAERPNWVVQPCDKCGLPELFDAPSDLMKALFPNMPDGGSMEMFTSFCGACGGVQVVQCKNSDVPSEFEPSGDGKKWWQFWK